MIYDDPRQILDVLCDYREIHLVWCDSRRFFVYEHANDTHPIAYLYYSEDGGQSLETLW